MLEGDFSCNSFSNTENEHFLLKLYGVKCTLSDISEFIVNTEDKCKTLIELVSIKCVRNITTIQEVSHL